MNLTRKNDDIPNALMSWYQSAQQTTLGSLLGINYLLPENLADDFLVVL
ncbi:MAG: hypothetical protein ACJA2G_002792 [Cognaticolwellia sp.]|jgi:hypothetical protein